MATLTRYTPFDGSIDGLFRSFIARPSAFDAEPVAKARIDVTEDDAAYTVHAEIPGVKKDDIHVTIDGNQVAITAEVKNHREENQGEKQGEKVLRSERYYGKVHRAFSLAQEVDEAASEAKYSDGVLELRLPKKAVAPVRKLSIQ